ncbi:MAG TPA: homogentisate 1,2-dioxygenase, partial [Phnomibacter sp.]|nr:homogentisate 1,2-dioxygenase [Phnomibacter sp.]
MPHYFKLGQVPPKRHTQFRQPNGSLYHEQLFSTEGFSNDYSLLYHVHPPTAIVHSEAPVDVRPQLAEERMLKHRSFEGFIIAPAPDYLQSRQPVLVNSDVHISLAAPQQSQDGYFYKNADADEVIFIHEGSGTLHTQYGS